MALKSKKETEEAPLTVEAELVSDDAPVKEDTIENNEIAVMENKPLPDYAILNPEIPSK